jgi:methionyl aminopeptidase
VTSSFQIFTPEEIASLRKGGKILRECLEKISVLVKPGVETRTLDLAAEEFIRSHGAQPGFKGYHGYPATLCTSVNEEAVHGIPDERALQEGDIVSLDCGVLYDGLYTDACVTVAVGKIPADVKRFLTVTEEALAAALAVVRPGARVGDISSAIQHTVENAGFQCVHSLTGHGLGRTLHQFPDIPNVGERGKGAVLPPHTLLAIEPITSMGEGVTRDEQDGWTISTRDGSRAAHVEHTVLTTESGHEIIA